MAIRAELADGRVLEFPDDTDQSVIDRTVKQAITNPYSTRTKQELEAVSAAPSTVKDVGESLLTGTAGGIKALTDIFGAGNVASKKLEEIQSESFKRMTPERQRELAIEDELSRRASEEGFLAEAKQAGRSFLRSPLQQGVGALGSSLPVIAATALAPEITIPAALAGRAGMGAAAARTAITNAPGIAVGAGMGVGSQKGQDYERVKQAMLERGATEEEAEAAGQRAAEYSMQNAARQAAAGVAGGAEAALGVESLIGRAGRARMGAKGGAEAPTWGQAITQSTLGETIPEAIQSGVGGVGSNIALQQAGIDTDLFKGVAGEMTSGALAAALLGSAVSPLQMRQLSQEFARDQEAKKLEELKGFMEQEQKRRDEIAKTEEQLGTQKGLALPAPVPKVEEQDPLQNPLGNLTKNELGPEVVGYIEQYRSANGMPLLNSYSIEDVRDAMTQVNPAGEAAALDSLVAAKSGYQPDVTYSADDVLNAATNKVDTTTQGFKDFLRRTTGSEDLNTMSQPQLYAAFKALEAVPVGQGLTILPVGTNASRFTEVQMVQGLDAIANELTKGNSVTPEQAITAVKQATGLQNDRDAVSLIKQLVRDNNLDSDADNNLIAPTEVKNLPAGYTLEKGTFKQADQQLYGVLSDGKPLEGVDTYTNPQDAQAKVDALNKTREKQAKTIQDQIQKIQDQIDRSQQNLDAMEAAGEGGTDAYKQAKAQHEALVNKVTDNIHTLQARQMMFQTPLTMGPMGMKQVNRTGYTLFKDGVPVSTHPTADAAMDSLVGTLPDADVEAIAEDRTPGMRTIARKARQRIERQSRPARKEPEQKAPEVEVTEEDKKNAQVLYKSLGRMLKKFGLRDVELQILKGMEDEGSYVANLIKIALDAKDALGVLRHESIHALKDLGFFSPQQWATLERMAKEKWIDQYLKGVAHDATRSRYDAYVDEYKGKKSEAELEELLIEEAIADAFRGFGNKPPPGLMTAILNKIKDFFARLKEAFNMAGIETAEEIFGRIERGGLKPVAGEKPNNWKASKADLRNAQEYYDENGIMPYTSEGQLDVPLESDGTKYSIKSPYTEAQAKGRIKKTREGKLVQIAPKFNDPVTGLPLNSNGTVTLYYPTTNEGAREMARVKRLRGHSPEATRIYLTNESSASEIEKKPGDIDQPVGGANVLLQVYPSWLQVAQEYDNGRKDFYIPIAEGQYFAHKAKMTKMFTLFASRKKGLHPDRKLLEVAEAIESTVDAWKNANKKQRDEMFADAKDVLNQQHNVSNLFGANAKLEKTNIGEYGLTYEGKKVISTGLGFASAQKISDKTQETTCPKSAICEDLCLGETSGQNELYGGEGPHRSGPRLSQFLKTEAFIVNPEAFTTSLIRQIERFRAEAKGVDYYPAIRLNVTSDFPGKMFKPIMDMFPDVKFYDYTKLVTAKPVASNHHLTYSSTGASQIVKGETILNKESNWDQLVDKVLPNGMNVAMAFTSRNSMPKFIYDERTDQTFEVWNGDEYDARFLDPERKDGMGWIIGLTNKDRTTDPENAAKERDGFFLNYNPERDGDTLTIKNQNKLAGKPEKKVIPIAKKSLRSQQDQETVADGKERQDLYDDFSPELKQKLDKLIEADRNAEGILVGRYEGKEQQRLKSIAGRALRSYEKAFEEEFPGSDITAASVAGFFNREGRFHNYDELVEKKSLRAPDTKEFKRLFGDTKVVDEDGNPQVVYRGVVGTEQGIEEGALNAEPRMGYATFGSTSPYVANSYANPEAEFGETGAVTPLYIKADNLIEFPVSVDKYGMRRFDKLAFDRKAKSLPAGTALVARQVIDIGPRANAKIDPEKLYSYYSDIYAWGSGTVVKSATGNIGTYDATNPDIRKSLRAPDWVPQNIWDLHEKVVLADDEASGRVAIPGRGKAPGALKRNQTMAFRRLNDAVDAYVGGDEQAALDLMTRMNQESTRREEEAPVERKSLRAPDTPEFNGWFSDSKAVDGEGQPMVMYHGTARDISEFKPGVAKAIFISPDPEFAEIFSEDSFNWLANNAKDELSEADQTKTKETAIEQIEKDYEWLDKKDPDYKKLLAHKEGMIKDIQKNAFKKKIGDEAMGYLAAAAKNYLPSGPNIMPLFVRAVNPFDYENKKHIDMVVGRVLNFMPESVTTKMEFPEKYLAGLKGLLSRGLFTKLEEDAVQKAIRSLGFDSFYVKEMGRKNLAVYSPVQVKSATGNIGTYDIESPDIRKSLRPQITPQEQARINETVGKRDEKSWLRNLLDSFDSQKIRQATLNRYETIGVKEKALAKQKGVDKFMADVSAESAALMSDYASQIAASAFGVHDGVGGIPVYKNGVTKVWNDNGKIKGPIQIFEPLAKLRDPEVFRDWQFWLSAKRGSRLEQDGREKLFTPADLALAKSIEAKYPAGLFESVRKDWDTYNRGLVNYMIDTGVISKPMGEEWMKHGDYFPFYRQQMDEDAKGPRIFSTLSGVKPPKKLKGGTATVGDFFENVIRNTQSAIEAGMKNVAAERAIRNELELKDAVEVLDHKGQPRRPTSMTNVVTVQRNGVTHYYECADKMFVEAMKGLNMAEIPGLQIAAAPANLLRALVTKTPDFILANLMRDSLSAWVTSGAKITPIIDTAKGFTSILANKDPDIQALYNAGLIGGYEFTGKTRESGKDLAKKLRKKAGAQGAKEKALSTAGTVWEALEKGSSASDAATRLAVYKETLAKTGNEAEALFRAMEIMNFQRKGNSALIRILSAVTPFLNARVQGLDVIYRAGIRPFVDPSNATAYEQAIAKSFIKRGLSLMALTAMYYAMVHDDEDYLAQEEETRDNNWIIPGLGVKIPIPFEVGIIFKVMPERIMAYISGNDTGEQLMKSAYRNITSTFGIQVPQAVLPLVEVATGHSFFTGRPITPAGMEDVSKEFRVTPGTSKLAEVLGQFTSFKTATGSSVGLSPIEIDHVIKGYTGTMGTYAVDAMDVLIGLNSDIQKPSKRIEQMPFIRRFALDPEARGNVTAYYELKNAVDEAVRTSNLLERTGRVEDLVTYQQENMPLLASKDYVNELYKTLKEFNLMKQQIRTSTMDADDKRDIILAIEQSENALLGQVKDYKKMISQ